MNLASFDPFLIGTVSTSDMNVDIFNVEGQITDFIMTGLKDVTVKNVEYVIFRS